MVGITVSQSILTQHMQVNLLSRPIISATVHDLQNRTTLTFSVLSYQLLDADQKLRLLIVSVLWTIQSEMEEPDPTKAVSTTSIPALAPTCHTTPKVPVHP